MRCPARRSLRLRSRRPPTGSARGRTRPARRFALFRFGRRARSSRSPRPSSRGAPRPRPARGGRWRRRPRPRPRRGVPARPCGCVEYGYCLRVAVRRAASYSSLAIARHSSASRSAPPGSGVFLVTLLLHARRPSPDRGRSRSSSHANDALGVQHRRPAAVGPADRRYVRDRSCHQVDRPVGGQRAPRCPQHFVLVPTALLVARQDREVEVAPRPEPAARRRAEEDDDPCAARPCGPVRQFVHVLFDRSPGAFARRRGAVASHARLPVLTGGRWAAGFGWSAAPRGGRSRLWPLPQKENTPSAIG